MQIHKHWELLEQPRPDNPWRPVVDEFTGDPSQFQERHYIEFVTFLPYVQRFLYGESSDPAATYGGSPIRVFRRTDVARVRMIFDDGEDAQEPELFNVAHTDLYFFYDLDIVLLALEIYGQNLTLERAQDVLFRFGRGYPHFWDSDGHAGHCLQRVEWLALGRTHLGTEALYAEVRQEVQDMSQYLDSDGLRRQADTVVRLTVVTIFGLR